MGSVRRARPALAALLLLAALAPADVLATGEDEAAPTFRYRVLADPEVRRLRVEVCFEGAPPLALVPGIDAAAHALTDASDAARRPLPVRGGRVDLRSLPAGGCMSYGVDLDEARRASRFSGRFARDVMTSAGAWLWRPARIPRGGATLRFELPRGVSAATPWPRERGEHRLHASAFQRASFTAFGRFTSQTYARQQAELEVVRLGEGWQLDDAGVRGWLDRVVDGVSTVQGRFPVDRLLVLLVPVPGDGVGFGMVRRGGGHSVALMIGVESTPERLAQSWVPWHELSHLQLPALPQRDAWLYEGLATYYQEVVRARAGVQTDRDAWRELLLGFDRGASGGSTGGPLAREAEAMPRTGTYLHVYWSGTAFILEADVGLRERGSSLDRAIARGARRWRNDHGLWTSERLCAAWDRTLDRAILRPLRDGYAGRADFPSVAPLFVRLGVARAGGAVELRDAELAATRDAIMRR